MQYRDTTRDGEPGSSAAHGEAELRRHLTLLSTALERERRAREAAETAARLKNEKFATLVHDLRSPLNAILGWTQLLALKCADPQVAAILPRIESSARAQIKILNDTDITKTATPPDEAPVHA